MGKTEGEIWREGEEEGERREEGHYYACRERGGRWKDRDVK